MLGFDGTGPLVGVPVTRRGRGFCLYPPQGTGVYSPWIAHAGRSFTRRRLGFGLRRGWGSRGCGRRWW